jgi:hypothetical protein
MQTSLENFGRHVSTVLYNYTRYLLVPKTICTLGIDDFTEDDIDICRFFTLNVRSQLSRRHREDFRFAFRDRLTYPSDFIVQHHIDSLTGLTPPRYDCCKNSCICYVGDAYSDRQACPFCDEPRFRKDGKTPQQTFMYIPLVPRFQAFFQSLEMIERLAYRSRFQHDGSKMRDIFDGRQYQNLLKTKVNVKGQTLKHRFFSDLRDIAFALGGDGVVVHKRNKHGTESATPLLAVLFNLDPKIRTHQEYLLPLGVIPGPNQPKDLDSFLTPFRQECLELAKGIPTFDALSQEYFHLHAYPLSVLGDMIFIEKILHLRGHNGFCPCRACLIQGILKPGGTTYYVPLTDPVTNLTWENPMEIPPREESLFVTVPRAVRRLPTQTARNALAMHWGINDTPILYGIPSLTLPSSFPHDFMHLLAENIIPNLLDFWTGKFKKLPEGTVRYQIPEDTWLQVGKETEAASALIPSPFCSKLPNIATDRRFYKAELYFFWFVYLAPLLLKGRFLDNRVYRHMLLLVHIIKTCLAFEISSDEIDDLERDIVQWVRGYEE